MNFEQKKLYIEEELAIASSYLRWKLYIMNGVPNALNIFFFMVYHILVVIEGLCFYCSGQHCVLCHEIPLRMCGKKKQNKDCVSESLLFINVTSRAVC